MRDIVMVMGAGLIGFSALHLYQRSQKSDVSSLADDKNAAETFHSEMNQDMSAPSGELNRLNPTVVEGAEDIMGAETVGGNRNYVFMHPWNDLTPQKAGPYYSPFSVPSKMETMPTNPRYYDGSYASAHQPHGIGLYDVANDSRPQYQFPDYYSVSYNPLDSWRPADDQTYTTV
jgi:hypothetical protein